jgi:MinD-like ATPase involved in chromosome partitioning or flagellar assembly
MNGKEKAAHPSTQRLSGPRDPAGAGTQFLSSPHEQPGRNGQRRPPPTEYLPTCPEVSPAEPLPQPPPEQPLSPNRPHSPRQKVVVVWSGKAGVGRSTLAAGMADLLSKHGRTCMLDLNPVHSSLSALFGKEQEPNSWLTISDSLWSGQLTQQTTIASLVSITPQLSLLTGPAGSEQWMGQLNPSVVRQLIDHLRREFEYVVLDVPAGRTPSGDAALRAATSILVLVSAFYPDLLYTTQLYEQATTEQVISKEHCRLILTQWVEARELPQHDVSACLGLPITGVIPMAVDAALTAARSGRPVTQHQTPQFKPLRDAIEALTMAVGGLRVAEKRQGFWPWR